MSVPSFPTIRLFGPSLPALGLNLSACRHGCDTSAEVLDEVVRLVSAFFPDPFVRLDVESIDACV